MIFLVILYEDERIDVYFDISEAYTKKLVYGEEKKEELYTIFQDKSRLRIPWNDIRSIQIKSFSIDSLKEAIEHAEHKQ